MTFRRITPIGASTLALSAVVSLVGLASPVLAADGANPSPAADSVAAQHVADRDAWHIKELHDQLKITMAQEPLWEKVAGVMRTNDGKIDALIADRHDHAGTMTAIEGLRSYAAITEAHAEGTRTFIPAFETLYQAMPTEQQANADRVFRAVGSKSHKKAQ
jgi:hypothetical protein